MSNLSPFCDMYATSGPLRGSLLEPKRTRAHHAKSLTRGRFHHPPRADLLHSLRPEHLQPAYLGFQVVGFDVEMHAAGVIDFLHLEVQAMLGILQPFVGVSLAPLQFAHFHAERSAPEPRCSPQVVGAAVDDEAA